MIFVYSILMQNRSTAMESPIRPFFWQSGEQSLAVGNTSSTEGTRVRQKWATHYAVRF